MIEGILFDVGGVLVGQGDMLRSALEAFRGVDRDVFWSRFNEAALPACRGEESLADCWRRMAKELGVQIPEERLRSLWIEDFREGIALQEDVLGLARDLMGRYKVGIVSNSIPEHSAILAELGVYDGFDPVILSHEAGLTKDDPTIFALALKRIGTASDRTLFIDDVERFARTAEAAGMRAIVYRDPGQLRRSLRALGFEV
jgi:putative hydrolase of the HAD superfamily